ncbi:MAG TPA: glycosyltransferase family 2 protein [Thermoanaerobaculia bacterium]|jgi:GT2 family glycosyltransferase|nr:glycosyltransferase family 2 protein [Thermoanaerobaculia bacterium]
MHVRAPGVIPPAADGSVEPRDPDTARRAGRRLAIVIVHYRTPDLAAECVAALRADLPGSEASIVLVDNGSEPEGRERLGALGIEILDPGENLGFAGGVNVGVERSLDAGPKDAIVILNPDVLVRPGCLAALLAELDAGAAAAGPTFFWDRGERLLLPPTERRTRRDELRAAAAHRGGSRADRARAHWRRHARAHWQAGGSLTTPSLSGALLAIRADAWAAVGPFDAEYRLYFEETDWLMRLAARGLESRLVPAARAIHLYAQSALREPASEAWFAASAERFYRRWYGVGFSRLLAAVAPADGGEEIDSLPPLPAEGLDLERLAAGGPAGAPIWIEISPSLAGFPAAAERIERPAGLWRLPEEIAERLPAGRWSLLASDEEGRELGRWELSGGGYQGARAGKRAEF